MLTPIFHYGILQDYMHEMNIGAKLLVEFFEKHGSDFIDVRRPLKLSILDTLAESAMGQQFDSLKSMQNGEKSEGETYLDAVASFGKMLSARCRKPWTKINFIWKLTSMYKAWQKQVDVLHNFTNEVITKQQNSISNSENSPTGKKKIFLDYLLQMKNDGHLTDAEVRSQVDSFMFAGHDTTSIQLTYICSALGREKEWQTKCREEIDFVLDGSSSDITSDQISQFHVLDRFIKECQRMYPSVPAIGRHLTEDLEIEPGVFFPSGIRVIAQLHALHMNPDFWSEPDRFDPDRFLPENVANRHPFAFVPFSAGLRNCIGQRFAMLEMKIKLAHMLHHFDLHSDQSFEDLQPTQNIVMAPHNKVLVQFTPRIK